MFRVFSVTKFSDSRSLMQTSLTDADALAAAVRGDGIGLETLYDRYGRAVYSLALRIVRLEAEAEDVVQEAFAQVFRQAARYDSRRGSVSTWLLTITRTRAIDHLRARKRSPNGQLAREPEAAAANVPDPGANQESQTLTAEQAQRVRRALDQLPQDQRTALELAYYEGLSQSEIAERLREPLGTVKSRIRAAMAKLRGAL
jgi:RNA polymerase sigma-70 factor (ECF subfamily)